VPDRSSQARNLPLAPSKSDMSMSISVMSKTGGWGETVAGGLLYAPKEES
jgi:hypothetical protein